MANIANSSLPEYVSGMLNATDWINQINGILSFAAIREDVKKIVIPNGFTPTVGILYLVAAGSVTPYTPGTIVIWLDPIKPPQGFNPSPGTVIGGWTKNSTGNDWINNSIIDCKNGSIFITSPSTAQTITLPNNLDGLMTICHYGSATLTINAASGRSANGKVGLPLNSGVYQVFQNNLITLI